MNLFIKILDPMDPDRVSSYTAWMIERLMTRYTKGQKDRMWATLQTGF